ncbi:hypothetical protein ACVILH_004126 [Bradyrhizobium sp. USDA 4353]
MGEAIVRHSLRPSILKGRDGSANPGHACRGNAKSCLWPGEMPMKRDASPTSVIASAAKQSRVPPTILDCFAALAMTEEVICAVAKADGHVRRAVGCGSTLASGSARPPPSAVVPGKLADAERRRAPTRDPYAVSVVGLRKPRHLVSRHGPVVMDPGLRRDDGGGCGGSAALPRAGSAVHAVRPATHPPHRTGQPSRQHAIPRPVHCHRPTRRLEIDPVEESPIRAVPGTTMPAGLSRVRRGRHASRP